MHVDLRDPLFKACTRPAMMAGVPLVPLVLVVGAFLMLGSWTFLISPTLGLLVIACGIPVVLVMRFVDLMWLIVPESLEAAT